jgi:hypothetical protein
MSQRTGIGAITIHNAPYEVGVTPEGTFHAQVEGIELSADTLEGLKNKICELLKRRAVRVAVRCTVFDGLTARHGTLTGFHAATGNLLLRWDDSGHTEQISGSSSAATLRALNEAEAAEPERLHQARSQAIEAFERFVSEYRLNAVVAVREAVEQAVRLQEKP